MSQDLRLTPEERDRVLELAARLQAQHEATIAVDELARAAEESGIEARFVHEAALALKTPSRKRIATYDPLAAFVVFVVQVGISMARQRFWALQGLGPFDALSMIFDFGLPFVLALFVARSRSLRWFVPLTPIVVWVAMCFGTVAYDLVVGPAVRSIPASTFPFILLHSFAALAGTLIIAILARTPEEARSFRLHRGQRT